MNAYDLGNSILETAKMLYKADKLVNKEKTVEIQVVAPAREGSFAIDFAVTLLNTNAIDIMKYIGLTVSSASIISGSALQIARRIRGKKVISVVTNSSESTSTIEVDGEVIKCDRTVATLVTNPEIRKAMNEIITRPLSDKDAPVFRVEVDGVETVKFEGNDVLEFTPLPKNSLSTQKTRQVTTNITLTQINFESSNGWKMVYEDVERSVKMEDESFMQKVRDNAKSFTKGDMFEVNLTIVYKATAKTEKTKYIITNVIRHRAASDRKLV